MSGYTYCACRDCFETIVGEDGDYCDACKREGCPDYQGVEGMNQECQRPDAYGSPDCPECNKSDEVWYDETMWKCGRCNKEKKNGQTDPCSNSQSQGR